MTSFEEDYSGTHGQQNIITVNGKVNLLDLHSLSDCNETDVLSHQTEISNKSQWHCVGGCRLKICTLRMDGAE